MSPSRLFHANVVTRGQISERRWGGNGVKGWKGVDEVDMVNGMDGGNVMNGIVNAM